MENMQTVLEELKKIEGVTGCWILPTEDRRFLFQLETESNLRKVLPGIVVENDGIHDVLRRGHVVAISHSPVLRHPPGPILVLCDEKGIVGEEVADSSRLEELSADPNIILLGSSLVLYRDRLVEARGKQLKLEYRALRFPELERLEGIADVVSITIGGAAHKWLAEKTGWGLDDSNLGTVLIGFNDRDQRGTTRESGS